MKTCFLTGFLVLAAALSAPAESPARTTSPSNSVLRLALEDKTLSDAKLDQLDKLLSTGDQAAALGLVQEARKEEPDSVLLVLAEAQVLTAQNKEGESRSLLESLWKNGSRDPHLVAALAQLRFSFPPDRLAELAELLPASDTSMLSVPLHPMTEASALYASGQIKAANSLAEKTAAGDRTLLGFYYGKCAEIETLNRSFATSAALLKKAVEISPQPEEAWLVNLATMLLQQQDFAGTRTYAERLLVLNPGNQVALDKLSVSCFRLNDLQGARSALLRLRTLQSPPNPQVLERLRQVEAKLNAPVSS
ncbi:MAG: tetratricopeptide repeat protein [Terrimicrobiaceae bacterium]